MSVCSAMQARSHAVCRCVSCSTSHLPLKPPREKKGAGSHLPEQFQGSQRSERNVLPAARSLAAASAARSRRLLGEEGFSGKADVSTPAGVSNDSLFAS